MNKLKLFLEFKHLRSLFLLKGKVSFFSFFCKKKIQVFPSKDILKPPGRKHTSYTYILKNLDYLLLIFLAHNPKSVLYSDISCFFASILFLYATLFKRQLPRMSLLTPQHFRVILESWVEHCVINLLHMSYNEDNQSILFRD